MFHLVTHAFFKALLFLAAGSVIIALHHEQDMRRMGGLRRYLPITYWTILTGAIASAGIPFFSGFYSKDAIIAAIGQSSTPGALFGYVCVTATVFVTAAYTFRMIFMAFHGEPRFDAGHPPHESPAVVTVPLVLLAIPSVVAGYWVGPVVYGEFFGRAVPPTAGEFHGVWDFTLHGFVSLPFWLAVAGIATAVVLYLGKPHLPKRVARAFGPLYAMVERKYGFDELYSRVFAGGVRLLGRGFWRGGDQTFIDGLMVNGSARVVGWFAGVIRHLQSGLLNQYAVAMLFGLLILTFWLLR
jgi:NADH-quinone oxidoreductase subunit L